MIFQQPLNPQSVAVEDFLVGLQRDDDVTIGRVTFLFVADQGLDKGRRHELVIDRAACIKIAVLFDQLERIN